MKRYAILVAGGQGLRIGSEIPKQFLPLNGRPILFYTLEKFHGIADEIILVLPETHIAYWKELCRNLNFETNARLVVGGINRTQSVMNGLLLLKGKGVVAIHDAVRPLISKKLIEKLYEQALLHGNSVPCVLVNESLRFRNEAGNHAVNRKDFVAVQTPQCFDYHKIFNAYNKRGNKIFTDDAGVFEHSGESIILVEGETFNIKITFEEDLVYAAALLNASKM